nr:hypothetical protein [Tanacetum cinerariifolium]
MKNTWSQPQGNRNTDAPESSVNSNPIATSTNSSDDQLETLTVETLIPTARVTNPAETPSLDNILTLTNQFEDILGDTLNSKESNGVEANVSNMKITITASPTPTLRIHRDHPKNPSWVEAMQEELLQFKIQKVWSLVDCPKGMDVKSTFLYGTIDEEVYVMQPPGF